jgi:hypothetical protein
MLVEGAQMRRTYCGAFSLARLRIRTTTRYARARRAVRVDAADVANAALFLTSDEARHIIVVTLPVDAGATQH